MSSWLSRFHELTRTAPPGDKSDRTAKTYITGRDEQSDARNAEGFVSLVPFVTQIEGGERRAASPNREVAFDWRRAFADRCAAYRVRDRDEATVAHLARADLENRWHLEYGERVSPDLCAGCLRSLGRGPALDLIDGCRVHAADADCLTSYGERWRAAARQALVGLGLPLQLGGE
jgi:hypothetical protein